MGGWTIIEINPMDELSQTKYSEVKHFHPERNSFNKMSSSLVVLVRYQQMLTMGRGIKNFISGRAGLPLIVVVLVDIRCRY